MAEDKLRGLKKKRSQARSQNEMDKYDKLIQQTEKEIAESRQKGKGEVVKQK